MADYKKVIAVCGVWLYEEKEYSFIKLLSEIAKKYGYAIMVFNFTVDVFDLQDDIMREKKLIELLAHLKCDAVVVMGETVKDDVMLGYISKTIKDMDVPAFVLERSMEGFINIVADFGEGFKNMVRHLINHHGYRKIDMIAGVKGNDFSEARIKAYKEALEENGIPFEEKRLFYGDFWDRPARLATEKIVESGDIPDAIVCANDAMAIAVCALLHEKGYRVPEDIAVTGFDGIPSGKVNYPTISTVAPDNEAEIELIFELLRRIENGENPDLSEIRYVDYRLEENVSCGCGKKDDKETAEKMRYLAQSFNDQKWSMTALNKLLLSSGELGGLCGIQDALKETVGLWMQHFYFVSVYEQFYNEDGDNDPLRKPKDDSCVSILRIENFEDITDNTPFSESEILPGIRELFRADRNYDLFMVRLLHSKTNMYGYLVTGFVNLDERCMRRTEEFGSFLSTTIGAILKNRKLISLNEQLRLVNKEMQYVSVRDYLTDLYNRRGFLDEIYRLEHLKENRNRVLTFFSIDMDGLKKINDTYGHEEGDFALKALAGAIRHFSIRNGICARYGGDEFVCAIITDKETGLDKEKVRARFDNYFKKNQELTNKPYKVEASIGISFGRLDDTFVLDTLIKNADEAMYMDKTERKSNRV